MTEQKEASWNKIKTARSLVPGNHHPKFGSDRFAGWREGHADRRTWWAFNTLLFAHWFSFIINPWIKIVQERLGRKIFAFPHPPLPEMLCLFPNLGLWGRKGSRSYRWPWGGHKHGWLWGFCHKITKEVHRFALNETDRKWFAEFTVCWRWTRLYTSSAFPPSLRIRNSRGSCWAKGWYTVSLVRVPPTISPEISGKALIGCHNGLADYCSGIPEAVFRLSPIPQGIFQNSPWRQACRLALTWSGAHNGRIFVSPGHVMVHP